MDRGAWQATVHRLPKSRTRLKQLSMHAGYLVSELNLVFFLIFIFIYLAALGLSCTVAHGIFFFCYRMHTLSCSMGDQVPQTGTESLAL